MRWFTCTPFPFGGGPDFFARDSGLLCRGFQMLGIESRAVMPGTRLPEDEADLIRTSHANLESADWWRARELDGIVLYAWGRPRYRRVAAAIREAGIFLVLNQDSSGLVSPLAGLREWLAEQRISTGGDGRRRFLLKTVRGLTAGLFWTDPWRAAHFRHGDVIAAVSPQAADRYRKLCKYYGGNTLAEKVRVVPHPVEPAFRWQGLPKLRQVACVGRWQDNLQKRPSLLMDVLTKLVEANGAVRVEVVGEATDELRRWHESLHEESRGRVYLRGRLGRVELAEVLARSQVFYSSSAYESFGIAAGEALCSGCTVVAGTSVSMLSFQWFVSENSGTLASGDSADEHAAALLEELAKWEAGQRDPAAVSSTWSERLHADKVAAKVLELAKSGAK